MRDRAQRAAEGGDDKRWPAVTRIEDIQTPAAPATSTRRAWFADIDIWRAANLLVKRHGRDARLFAAQRIDEMLAEGDLDGRSVWCRILEAVTELERTKPAEGERVN